MGGKKFANTKAPSGELVQTPRISPEIYEQLSAEYLSRLGQHFERVVTPRDPPGKADYGDIDYQVGGIKQDPSTPDDVWSRLKHVLDAEIHLSSKGSHSYAVPHPKISDAHVQIDIELAPGDGTPDAAELFRWTQFMNNDADLQQILGVSHRSLGLTCNDKGLHIRVEEVEPQDAKRSFIFLTRDPETAMKFYGLDTTDYWAGFVIETKLFDWATSGRFFYPQKYEKMVEKSNDRSRVQKRPMYNRFVTEYMPAHSERGATNDWTRQQVLEEALKTFNIQEEYDAMIEKHHFNVKEKELWEEVSAALPSMGKNSLTEARKALRRWVDFEDGRPRIASTPSVDRPTTWSKDMTPGSKDELLDWVKAHWEQAKALEKARAKAAKEAAVSSLLG
ncbi:hypothetical protein CC86DRAFT_370128 [Ophiobolus disseminans]|uniref:Uncharacterized protein n=1 Tax=Ophiobolus disseminans TaxID=1469910 RepID=A0A6A7A1B8_9PLEO|nr:hypothetical protein CC86DRAFT_370128 [Ophiobolus disseminans]